MFWCAPSACDSLLRAAVSDSARFLSCVSTGVPGELDEGEEGALTLAVREEGGLTLAAREEGVLTLAAREEGALSLAAWEEKGTLAGGGSCTFSGRSIIAGGLVGKAGAAGVTSVVASWKELSFSRALNKVGSTSRLISLCVTSSEESSAKDFCNSMRSSAHMDRRFATSCSERTRGLRLVVNSFCTCGKSFSSHSVM